MIPEGAQCAVHAAAPAVDTCARCGNFVCAACMELHAYETYCPECISRVSTRGEQSGRATAALVCGLLPLFILCFPVGIVGLVLGQMELAAIDAGTSPAAGRNLAKGGVILGWIWVAVTVLVGVGLAVAFAT